MVDEKLRTIASDRNFKEEVLDSRGPMVLDFSAEWCSPCRQVSSTLDDIAGEYEGRLRFVSLDIDRSPRAARRFHVRSVPTILFLHDGQVVDQASGVLSRNDLVAWINRLLTLYTNEEQHSLKLAS